MIFSPTPLAGLYVVASPRAADARGHFGRLWCADSFARSNRPFAPTQISTSFNHSRGTLRGLHWQEAPHGETKLVRAIAGRVFDVAVDLRPDSPTRLRSFAIELAADEPTALLIPPGFAHGFLTLTDGAELLYMIDTPYAPEAARGARFDDPALDIVWPHAPTVIGERDLAFPPLA
jgi:dTDP-4-dehydrorhamnose 3,5-epimerase